LCCAQAKVNEVEGKLAAAAEATKQLQEQLSSTKAQLEAATARAEQLQQQLKREHDEKVG
jgi:multidrug resistance efflux pump